MSQQSKLRQSRNQWKRKAKERAEHNQYLRKELERIRKERDHSRQALKETQARLRQKEAQAQGLVVHHKVDLVWLALQLFVGARISFRAVSRVLRLLAEVLGIKKAPCPQTLVNWVTSLSIVRIQSARLLQGGVSLVSVQVMNTSITPPLGIPSRRQEGETERLRRVERRHAPR